MMRTNALLGALLATFTSPAFAVDGVLSLIGVAEASVPHQLAGTVQFVDTNILPVVGLGTVNSPIVPRFDARDGKLWRGDQNYPERLDAAPGEAGAYRIRNVRWGFEKADDEAGRFETKWADARIDPSKVTRVTLLMSPFAPEELASHAALLFEFSEAGAVKDLTTGATASGLVISQEARMRAGKGFSLVGGVGGTLPLVRVVGTWEDYQQSIVSIWKGRIQRFVLDMSPEEMRGALTTGLDRALTDHRKLKYNLFLRSCVIGAVQTLNGGLTRERQIQVMLIGEMVPRIRVSISAWFPRFLEGHKYVRERLPELN